MALLTLGRKDKGDLATLRSQMNDLFNGFFEDWDTPLMEKKFWPAIDVVDAVCDYRRVTAQLIQNYSRSPPRKTAQGNARLVVRGCLKSK